MINESVDSYNCRGRTINESVDSYNCRGRTINESVDSYNFSVIPINRLFYSNPPSGIAINRISDIHHLSAIIEKKKSGYNSLLIIGRNQHKFNFKGKTIAEKRFK